MAVLIDTSVLVAFAFQRDAHHEQASRALQNLRQQVRIVAAPVLNELFYVTMVRINYPSAVQVFARTWTAFQIQPLLDSDMARMQAIMLQYQDAAFDFADVAIMALAERLNITQVYTFDRRDFSIFRPRHCDYLELLPLISD
ncbi:MAG: PIN domain-containing protein [Anaerolineae bacterium]|nr:PIN domain-containing protein [Anaerolineae bacterium]